MTDQVPAPTSAIRQARREVADLPSVAIDRDWVWDQFTNRWCLAFSVSQRFSAELPEVTKWVACVDKAYPKGDVQVYPSSKGGLTDTYPHQNNNGLNSKNILTRSGKLCLFNNTEAKALPDEPSKLVLYIEKAVNWIENAAAGTLVKPGDRFEMPDFNIKKSLEVAFNENDIDKMVWDSHSQARFGEVTLFKINETCWAVSSFRDAERNMVSGVTWGSYLGELERRVNESSLGLWVTLSNVPTVNNWQAPNTYGELRSCCNNNDIDFGLMEKKMFPRLRDGKRHVLLIGFPVGLCYGEEPDRLHWVALLLPKLSKMSDFSNNQGNEKRCLIKDRVSILFGSREIDWVRSSNWNQEELLSRGLYPESLADKEILIVGAGSLGSLVAEQLVRNGVTQLAISDSDIFQAGNLARHTLTIDDVGTLKAERVASRLNALNPTAEAKAMGEISDTNLEELKRFDVIIDCSGSTAMLRLYSICNFKHDRLLYTFAFSFGAENLYCTATTLNHFDLEEYQERFKEDILEDFRVHPKEDYPSEGIGCWSSVFPAKMSDVMRAACFSVDFVETSIARQCPHLFTVYRARRNASGYLQSFEWLER